jgi:hypothetical protein
MVALMLSPAQVAAISKLGDEVFEGLTITANGPQLAVDLAMPASLPDVLKLAAQMAAQSPARSAGGGKRSQPE